MYFKDFPKFLYDFNYGDNVTKTSLVRDITRNIRFRRDILANISLYDEYDIVDGETVEIIAEKVYGTPEYHWVILLANEKFDYVSDFPLMEPELQRHIKTSYNPNLTSTDWFWDTQNGVRFFNIKITSTDVPFIIEYLTAPVTIVIRDDDSSFVKTINYPTDPIGLNVSTQYFYFPVPSETDFQWLTSHSKVNENQDGGVGNVTLTIETDGRENNPVYFINAEGFKVNYNYPGAIPVTGAQDHRRQNDRKRRIRLISPTMLATILRNYKDLL
jgi:hypothetical protein